MSEQGLQIVTRRLELVAATVELAHAEMWDRPRFGVLLAARVPEEWPPPFNDEGSMRWLLQRLEIERNDAGWFAWYFVLRGDGERVVIGNGGFKGAPSGGSVEIGYSVLPQFQRRGYAFEAVQALTTWAFSHGSVERVIAETLPELEPSQQLLRKLGFRPLEGTQPGVLRFQLPRKITAL